MSSSASRQGRVETHAPFASESEHSAAGSFHWLSGEQSPRQGRGPGCGRTGSRSELQVCKTEGFVLSLTVGEAIATRFQAAIFDTTGRS